VTETPSLPLAWTDEGEGPALVLLHGFGAHGGSWKPWLAGLRASYRVVNVDLKGSGRAPKPNDHRYAPADLAGLVRDLVRRLDLREVTLVGHSLGGGIALLAALRLLDDGEGRLGRVVSVAGAAYPQRTPPFARLARHPHLSAWALALLPPRWLVRTVMRQIVVVQDAVTEERVEMYAAPLRDPAARRALIRGGGLVVPDDLETLVARYPDIVVPTLCLWGRQDRVVPLSVGRRLTTSLPNARLVILEGCGHLPMEEHPRESLAALITFLEETEADDATP